MLIDKSPLQFIVDYMKIKHSLLVFLTIIWLTTPHAVANNYYGADRSFKQTSNHWPKLFGKISNHQGNPSGYLPKSKVLRESLVIDDLPEEIFHKSVITKADFVNKLINKQPYVNDVADTWQPPQQFLQNGGDCEDYAIAKYSLLRQLGVPVNNMRLVIARDHQTNKEHAFLTILANGEIYLLDNQIQQLISHQQTARYSPIFSFNEHDIWFYWTVTSDRK